MTQNRLYQQFYREFYLHSGGWIPVMPLGCKLELGDFGQIARGGFKPLGNITQLRLVYEIKTTVPLALNPPDWQLESGLEKTSVSLYSQTNEQNISSTWSKQELALKQKGDFIFHGVEPKARLICNWSEFKQDITLRLTQTEYSFREVYLITALATVKPWGLAIAGADNAELDLVAETAQTDSYALLSHHSVTMQHSRQLALFENSADLPGYFFKAKKLVLSDRKKDQLIDRLLQKKAAQGEPVLADWLSGDLLNSVQTNELNAANCLEYFDWVDATLDDLEKLY